MANLFENVPYCYLRVDPFGVYTLYYTVDVGAGFDPDGHEVEVSGTTAFVEIKLKESSSTVVQNTTDEVILPTQNLTSLDDVEVADVYCNAYITGNAHQDQPTKTGTTIILYADADEE